ncbi:MAG TPA: glycosyltransferase family 39 protein [Chitinophagaceae bacterium]|nr:glycosyltransferase family 39 protein [Chitinophagaceae bacterium]
MQQFHKKYFWFLSGISVLLLFPGLGNTPLWIYDEVRNAECAREMFERGDWIVPTFNGGLRTLKPPLHYYFMFGGFEIFGVTEWGARFFSAVSGLFTILLTYFFVKKYSSEKHAFITGLVLLASSHFLFEFRMSVPDPYLIFFNVASIFTAYAFFREKKFYWLLLCAVCMGLGTLAKGPVAIALPGAAILLWLIWEKRWKEIFSWKIFVAGIIMLAVAVPWYWLVHKATDGEWTKGFFLQHNLGRFSEAMEGHGGLFILVPVVVLLGMLPASVFIGESLKNFKTRFSNSFLKLSFSVIAIFIVFYSISGTKLPNYAMPCYPFVAVLLGYYINKVLSEKISSKEEKPKIKLYPFIILLFINIALPVAGYIALKNEENTKGLENLAGLLLILTVSAFISFYFMLKNNFRKAAISGFLFYTLFHLVFFNWLYPAVYNQNPLTKTIESVKKYDKVVAYQIFHPSFTYYLPERVQVFKNLDSLRTYLSQNEAAVISRKNFSEELKSIQLKELYSIHDLFEGNTTVIYAKPL